MSSQQKRTLGAFVDYVLSLNLRIDAISESDTARQRLMIRYFEQIIDAMVYELFFGDELHRAGKYFFEPLARETLPIIEESTTDQKQL
jgi:hypothetical protein